MANLLRFGARDYFVRPAGVVLGQPCIAKRILPGGVNIGPDLLDKLHFLVHQRDRLRNPML